MEKATALVITSISGPTQGMREFARECASIGASMFVVGDSASPADFHIDGCNFLDVEHQRRTGLRTAALSPLRSYARKNIGYLLAMRAGARYIVETDDDNLAKPSFWKPRSKNVLAARAHDADWLNVYRYFAPPHLAAAPFWPRGFPLDLIHQAAPPLESLPVEKTRCPIQQALADDDPDVDAIYRLLFPGPIEFRPRLRIALTGASWCPFNSQNTAWWPESFALMYLPASCTMRMTDIWRGMVAQRIAFENGWGISFESPTVRQERNAHDLTRDFRDEMLGYLHNRELGVKLRNLPIRAGEEHIPDNLRLCYEELIRAGLLAAGELGLLEAWLDDYRGLTAAVF